VKGFGLPMVVLGGGGYTIPNVARCWVNETAELLEKTIPDEIPQNAFYSSYGPHYRLHFEPDSRIENKNTVPILDKLTTDALACIKGLEGAPSVQLHDRPPDFFPTATFDLDRPVVNEFYDQKPPE
jgi:hypothetical protein